MNIKIILRCPYDEKGGITSIDKQLALELIEQAIEEIADGLYVTIGRDWDGTIGMDVVNKHDEPQGEYTWQDGKWQ